MKTEMLRRNGPVIKPWSQSWGRKGVYGGKDLYNVGTKDTLLWKVNSVSLSLIIIIIIMIIINIIVSDIAIFVLKRDVKLQLANH